MNASQHRSGKTHKDENFPVASFLIEKPFRAPIMAFYDFVRTADDIADHATLSADEKFALLARMEAGLSGAHDEDRDAVRLREELFARGLSDQHARDLLAAFRQDVKKARYETFEELMSYCSLSAMPVGRFVLDVHGESRSCWAASDAICAALQIINHLQDCGKDYTTIDRVYLPARILLREGADVRDLAGPRLTLPLRRVVDDLLVRTHALLDAGSTLPLQITNSRLALEIGIIHRLATRIVGKLHAGDPLIGNVHLGRIEAAKTALGSAVATYRCRQRSGAFRQQTGEKA